MNRFFQSHIQNLQFTTVKMAYVTCLDTKKFTFELPGKCGTVWARCPCHQQRNNPAKTEMGAQVPRPAPYMNKC